MKINCVFVYILFLSFSCSAPVKQELKINSDPNIKRISMDDISKTKGIKYSDIFDSIRLVKLETTPESLIGRIDKIIYYKNKYFVLDQFQSKSVFVFDNFGKFINKIGTRGKGPGEYSEPNDIAIDQFTDKVVIYNNNGKSLLSYDFNGKFFEKIKLDYFIKSFAVLENNLFAVYLDYKKNDNISNKRSQFNLQIIDKRGKILDRAFKFENNREFGAGGFSFFNRFNETLLVSPSYCNTIFEISEKTIIPKYFIDFGKQTIPEELLSIRSKTEFDKEFKNSNYSYILNYFETPNYLTFSFVHKRMIYSGFYSKNTGELKYSNLFLNDIYGLLTGNMIASQNGDLIINYFEPSSIDGIKKIMNSSSTDGTKLRNELLKSFTLMGDLNEDMRIYKKLVETATFKPIEEEIRFINSIDAKDNPILIICKLKRF